MPFALEIHEHVELAGRVFCLVEATSAEAAAAALRAAHRQPVEHVRPVQEDA
jgi:hypothetical protein